MHTIKMKLHALQSLFGRVVWLVGWTGAWQEFAGSALQKLASLEAAVSI